MGTVLHILALNVPTADIVRKNQHFPLGMGSLEEGGKESHVGLMELKLSSWLILIICANNLTLVCSGSAPGTNPGSQSLLQALSVRAGAGSALRVAETDTREGLEQKALPGHCPLQKTAVCSS